MPGAAAVETKGRILTEVLPRITLVGVTKVLMKRSTSSLCGSGVGGGVGVGGGGGGGGGGGSGGDTNKRTPGISGKAKAATDATSVWQLYTRGGSEHEYDDVVSGI